MDNKSRAVSGLIVSVDAIKFTHSLFSKDCSDDSYNQKNENGDHDDGHQSKHDRYDQRYNRHDDEAACWEQYNKHNTCDDEFKEIHFNTP